MGTVYRKTFTKPFPTGAETITRQGVRLARWKVAGKTRTAPVIVGQDGTDRIRVALIGPRRDPIDLPAPPPPWEALDEDAYACECGGGCTCATTTDDRRECACDVSDHRAGIEP